MNDSIVIINASTHNLKNISLEIPKNKIVAFTGVSGSGKSSLVFDTIYTEAQRQLIETFSSFARARLPKLSRPPVDEIRNISTAIVIDQKRMGVNLRSTVGTATEISTYLRLLFSRCGDRFIGPSFMFGFNHPLGMCPDCKGIGQMISMDVDRLIRWDKTIREGAIDHPDYRVGGWHWREIVAMDLFPVDTPLRDFSERDRQRFLHAEAIPVEKRHGAGIYTKNFEGVVRKLQRLHLSKPAERLNKSRRSAYDKYFVERECPGCAGARISPLARSVRINGKNIAELAQLELSDLYGFLAGVEGEIARPLVAKARQILAHLIDIGVGYLSLNRPVSTLSGGESQRVKMARQLDCDLVDMMYILDEPSIGLHAKDIGQLLEMLRQLKDKGNSVLIVEHDPAVMACAEHIVDIGPGAGSQGGEIVFSGSYDDLKKQAHNLTAHYLNKREPARRERKKWTEAIEIRDSGAAQPEERLHSHPQGRPDLRHRRSRLGQKQPDQRFLPGRPPRGRHHRPVAGRPLFALQSPDLYRRVRSRAQGIRPGREAAGGPVQLQFPGRLPEMQGTRRHRRGNELPGRGQDRLRRMPGEALHGGGPGLDGQGQEYP